eukprot:TRINITY_DN3944_c0_g1_i2.p1 TRINITY_DN3944_c0_g1~~TRINITY_DN3944_c0_g1_i2.p1  ORF type:complete len:538 (-),score=154.12 TRINITY_DN3944_c0_g1_i2:141-1754(-)
MTAESRGFAFVDFPSVYQAHEFVDRSNGKIVLDGASVVVDRVTKQAADTQKGPNEPKDWLCPQCHGSNFARRTACFLCQCPKPEHPEYVAQAPQDNSNVGPVIIVRGIDFGTVEQTLWNVFQSVGPVKELRVIKDKMTGMPRGFCFVEFVSQEHATYCVENTDRFRIDNRQVKISYSRPANQNPPAPNPAIEQAQWLSASAPYNYVPPVQPAASSGPVNVDAMTVINSGEVSSRYVFDAKTGYYFDAKTRIYYEPNANFYYDSNSKNYYKYDSVTKQYIPDESKNKTAEKAKEVPKKAAKPAANSQILTIKKTAKELDRWNQKTKELKIEEENEAKAAAASAPVQIHNDAPPEMTEADFVLGNVCLLCKRQFNSPEQIQKHISLSDLHKHNLEMWKENQIKAQQEKAAEAEARLARKNRKAENREHHANVAKAPPPGLSDSNKGMQLMQKMGWKKGDGVGKQQILTAPINVEIRAERAGLGSMKEGNPLHAVDGNDDFRSAVKKRARARVSLTFFFPVFCFSGVAYFLWCSALTSAV